MQQENQPPHIPVLLDEVLQALAPQEGDSYLDVTAGYGGHAKAVAEQTHNMTGMCLVDRDPAAIAALQPMAEQGAQLIQTDFLSASQQLLQAETRFDMILADLGVSSPHLDNASRGFTFKEDGPIDMRMDTTQTLTAADIVNSADEAELADILWRLGEEPKSRQIARMIVQNRPFTSTAELAALVAKAWPGHSKVHPATRTFQALRIVTNRELELLEQALPLWIDLLKPGGRLVIISFHSLEDRIVKRTLNEYAEGYEAVVDLINKRPISASDDELAFNPRARSAKLRAVVKK